MKIFKTMYILAVVTAIIIFIACCYGFISAKRRAEIIAHNKDENTAGDEFMEPAFSSWRPSSENDIKEILDAEPLEILLEKKCESPEGETESYRLYSFMHGTQKEYALTRNGELLTTSWGPDEYMDEFIKRTSEQIDARAYDDPTYRGNAAVGGDSNSASDPDPFNPNSPEL